MTAIKPKMIAKIHEKEKGFILAVCDNELLGKKFSEGEKQLDLSSDFYKGDDLTDEEVADLMRNADIINLAGQKSVALAIKEELLNSDEVIYIEGIPHAEVILLHD